MTFLVLINDDHDASFRTVIPGKLRKTLLRYFHDPAPAGHSPSNNTYKLCHVLTWPGVRQDCPILQSSKCAKPRGGQPPVFMQALMSQFPWQMAAYDVTGPLPPNPRGNQYFCD